MTRERLVLAILADNQHRSRKRGLRDSFIGSRFGDWR
jgi:hypothetical protein